MNKQSQKLGVKKTKIVYSSIRVPNPILQHASVRQQKPQTVAGLTSQLSYRINHSANVGLVLFEFQTAF